MKTKEKEIIPKLKTSRWVHCPFCGSETYLQSFRSQVDGKVHCGGCKKRYYLYVEDLTHEE